MIETHIQGIPCQAEMVAGHYQKPDHTTWASADDYHGGWFDVEFRIYDRRGYKAGWLEKKMTEKDEERIIEELTQQEGE